MSALQELERAVMAADTSESLNAAHIVTEAAQEAFDAPPGALPPASIELMAQDAFTEGLWNLGHDMMGGMIQARTGAPCPLGDLARNEGGAAAAEACYQLILMSPGLARLILSPQSTFLGSFAAIGLHGFACVQCIKVSKSQEIQGDVE